MNHELDVLLEAPDVDAVLAECEAMRALTGCSWAPGRTRGLLACWHGMAVAGALARAVIEGTDMPARGEWVRYNHLSQVEMFEGRPPLPGSGQTFIPPGGIV